jgi:hypothetical protein
MFLIGDSAPQIDSGGAFWEKRKPNPTVPSSINVGRVLGMEREGDLDQLGMNALFAALLQNEARCVPVGGCWPPRGLPYPTILPSGLSI